MGRTGRALCIVVAVLAAAPPASAAPGTLRDQAGPRGTVARHSATGAVRFVGTAPGEPIARPAGAQKAPEAAARAFLRANGPAFGAADAGRELVVRRVRAVGGGQATVRFEQRYRGVPVLAGELNVNVDRDGNVLSAAGELSPDPSLDVTPAIRSAQARDAALAEVARVRGADPWALRASDAERLVFDNRLLGAPGAGAPVLVWRVAVAGTAAGEPVDDLVLVDARTGGIALRYSRLHHALDRRICDYNHTKDTCTPVRAEGAPPSGIADADAVYDQLGDAYVYMRRQFGRDGVDGAGLPLDARVRYGTNYQNAAWSYDGHMIFGDGFAVDDITAHELTHGVIQFEQALAYYGESGAINESIADIFGELVDQTNGRGVDEAVRWKVGEELAGGAVRDMRDPARFFQPDRMTSDRWSTDDDYDNGGVHTNSGVSNKAAFLMADGDTFNGYTVRGIGGAKVGKVYYRALTTLLTASSNYEDLHSALPQACRTLIDVAVTGADCRQVDAAVAATEMDRPGRGVGPSSVPECSPGELTTYASTDSFETETARWQSRTLAGQEGFVWVRDDAGYAASGDWYFRIGQGFDPGDDVALEQTSPVVIPEAGGFASFEHKFSLTNDVAGVVEYTLDDGATWNDAGPRFTGGSGYNATAAGSITRLAGRPAFTGGPTGRTDTGIYYHRARLDLSDLGGETIRLRFRYATGPAGSANPWNIDDVRVGGCAPPPALPAFGRGSSGAPAIRADFDGDGYQDLAVGAPGEDEGAGAVHVLMGGPDGLTAARSKLFTQDSAYVSGYPEPGDGFGSALASRDFDADGRADLAIGVPGEDDNRGAVHVLSGSGAGLTAVGSRVWSQDSPYVPGDAEPGDGFGQSLAAVDLGRLSRSDLVIGAPGEDGARGAVHVLYGADSGLKTAGTQLWTQGSPYVADDPEPGDRFGASLAGADFGGSAEGDLAIGAPGENADGGAVHVLHGSSDTGAKAVGSQLWRQGSGGVGDVREAGDGFGTALAAADLGRGAHADLAVGAPGENLFRGTVHVLHGSADRLTSTGTRQLAQGAGGIGETAEASDEFGTTLAAGDLGRGGPADLAIGAPGENDGGGAVHALYGSSDGGVAGAGAHVWSQDTAGMLGIRGAGDSFGITLAVVDLGRGVAGDLAVGAPGENGGAGSVSVIYGDAAGGGLTSAGNQQWGQNSASIADTAEPGDRFGGGLGG